MSLSMYTAVSGSMIQATRLEVLTNNLANIHSVGFKEDRPVFDAYYMNALEQSDGRPETVSAGENEGIIPVDRQKAISMELKGVKTDFSTGPLRYTGNTLDCALRGGGFFCIETGRGVQYTRKGNFKINEEGNLTTQDGFAVLGESGQIRLEGNHVVIDEQGNIFVDATQVDTLKIVDFKDLTILKKAGHGRFAPKDGKAIPIQPDEIEVNQGFVELANVNPIKIMTEMIEILRTYESYQKTIRSIENIDSKVINSVGKAG